MFKIIANQISARVNISRSGVRSRRLPVVQMPDGSTIKIAPGRAVVVTPAILNANKNLLLEMKDKIVVMDLANNKEVDLALLDLESAETIPPAEIPPEPIEEIEVEESKVVVVLEEEPVVEKPEPVKEEKPKPKRKRRSRAKKVESDS